MGSIRTGFPIIGKTLVATSRLTLESFRYDRNELPSDPPQGKTNSAAIWDLVFSGQADRFTYSVGAYNAGDHRHRAPVSAEYRMRSVPQNGRTFLFSLGAEI
jgi:hypothetical protein